MEQDRDSFKNQINIDDLEPVNLWEEEKELFISDKNDSSTHTRHNSYNEEEARSARRRQRIQEMRRQKKRQEQLRRFFVPCVIVLVVCIVFVGIGIQRVLRRQNAKKQQNPYTEADSIVEIPESSASVSEPVETTVASESKKGTIGYDTTINIAGCPVPDIVVEHIASEFAYVNTLVVHTLGGISNEPPLSVTADERTVSFQEEIISKNGILIDVTEGRILAERESTARIVPASMTKILTVLVAAEHITNLEDTVEITRSIADYCYKNDCTVAGFEVGEYVTIEDLFYGTVLPSGADASLALAIYVSGSQEAFVDLMNEKIDELGLSKTSHFTNCIGLYDSNHYSTAYDMAVMLKAAYDNSFCREVLSAHSYTTSTTEQHPDGLIISNWFLRKIEDKDTHGEVLCAKTGFVDQSGNCAASLEIGKDGKEYICVTAQSSGNWRCIYDHVDLYVRFVPE